MRGGETVQDDVNGRDEGMVAGATRDLRDTRTKLEYALDRLLTTHDRLLGGSPSRVDPGSDKEAAVGEMEGLVSEVQVVDHRVSNLIELADKLDRL